MAEITPYEGLPLGLQHNDLQSIQLEQFEGPLDLLLYLIKREEIDIYNIPIARITQQYLALLNQMEAKAIEIAGEFFLMAATLMLIKSRTLLPSSTEENDLIQEARGPDPRWELVEQLIEYKKYKEAAENIQSCIDQQYHYWPREHTEKQEKNHTLQPLAPKHLTHTFSSILLRLKERLTIGSIKADTITVADRIVWILTYLTQKSQFIFQNLWQEWPGKPIIATTFLALLELNRIKEIQLSQAKPFGPISVTAEKTVSQHTQSPEFL
jgi:segregation and condensation protein A